MQPWGTIIAHFVTALKSHKNINCELQCEVKIKQLKTWKRWKKNGKVEIFETGFSCLKSIKSIKIISVLFATLKNFAVENLSNSI